MDENKAVHDMFSLFDDQCCGELKAEDVQAAHEMIRMGGISMAQVIASMQYVCSDHYVCDEYELLDLLKEMDRRYFLIQDFRWEFSMLDMTQTDTITEEQAHWFIKSVHGENYSDHRWEKFLKSRPVSGTRVSFAEIEVELCNIPCLSDLLEEEEEERRKKAELNKKKQLEQEHLRKLKEEREDERRRLLEEQRRQEEERAKKEAERLAQEAEEKKKLEKAREEEERKRLEEEEKKRREAERERRRLEKEDEEKQKKIAEERLAKLKAEAEERRKQEEEEAKNIELVAKYAADEEEEAEKAAKEAAEKAKNAKDEKTKKEAENAATEAKRKQAEMKEKKIRANLKVAIKIRQKDPLKKGLTDFKKAKLTDDDGDVPVAERLLKLAEAKEKLKNAMDRRQLKELEEAIDYVKRNKFEEDLQPELIEANNLLLRLRRLERIRAEILELKQSTVAEIRSYSSPPIIVHSVMIATFLLLGHSESETKEWKKVQALVGKTGKEGLKRRCLEYDPQTLAKKLDIASKAKTRMSQFELDDVRDVSAGAATFYLWASNMIEEAELISETPQETKK